MRRGASHEASIALEHALAILDGLPRTPERVLRTIRLSLTLGSSMAPALGGGATAAEQRVGRRPELSDLRESGETEQAADIVLFLHRNDGDAELLVAKNRHG